jgi:hypothetical protein
MASISERESREIEAANASGTTPVVFSRAYSPWDLYRVRADGTGLERLTQTPWVDEEQAKLSNDGTIELVLSEGDVSRIALLTEKGIVTVTDGDSDRSVIFVLPRS